MVRQQLEEAIAGEDYVAAALHRDDLSELTSKDPAEAAAEVRKQLERAVKREMYSDAALQKDYLRVLRRFLPQYQLAGLWKGNYPNHGEEMIRVRYDGDMLYATKVRHHTAPPSPRATGSPGAAPARRPWPRSMGPRWPPLPNHPQLLRPAR